MNEDARIELSEITADRGHDLEGVVGRLRAARENWRAAHPRLDESRGRSLPSPQAVEQIMADLRGALFPMRLGPTGLRQEGEDYYVGHTLAVALDALLAQIKLELGYASADHAPAEIARRAGEILHVFADHLPEVRRVVDSDVEAAFQGDPAATSVDEVLLCYPGVLAIIHYRIAHLLYLQGLTLVPRIITELAHSRTGIDIHPAATIGGRFFIDHGTGVVIGATAIIGERVRLYQMVTLGAKSFPADENGLLRKGLPRHPIVEDDVVVYAGATILGRVTIGHGSIVGGNVWLTESVPPGSRISQTEAGIRATLP